MIHWPIHPHSIKHFSNDQKVIDTPPTIEEAVEALRILKKQGKIREFGVSNFSRNRLNDLPLDEIAANELPYNLLCRAIEFDTLPLCEEKGVGVIGYMALLQGILADIFPSLNDVPVWQRRTRHFNSEGTKECRHGEKGFENETNEALHKIRSLCDEVGLTMPEIAVKWILKNPAITCTLVGSRNIQELETNVKSVQEPLSTDIKDQLDLITLPLMEKMGNHSDYYESTENDRTR